MFKSLKEFDSEYKDDKELNDEKTRFEHAIFTFNTAKDEEQDDINNIDFNDSYEEDINDTSDDTCQISDTSEKDKHHLVPEHDTAAEHDTTDTSEKDETFLETEGNQDYDFDYDYEQAQNNMIDNSVNSTLTKIINCSVKTKKYVKLSLFKREAAFDESTNTVIYDKESLIFLNSFFIGTSEPLKKKYII